MSPAPKDQAPVSGQTNLKVNPDAVEGHAAEAAAVGGAKGEASIDLNSLMTASDAMVREQLSQELVNLVKARSSFFTRHLLVDPTTANMACILLQTDRGPHCFCQTGSGFCHREGSF